MVKRTKSQLERETSNIKYEPMKIKGDTAFKCINDDWGVIAFDIRRGQIEDSRLQFGDKELQYNCIYFLVGWDGLTEQIYVGQAKQRNCGGSVMHRLREHVKSDEEHYNDIWTRAIVVTGKDGNWGPTELNALENIFYNLIPECNRLNSSNPNIGVCDLEQFSEKVRQIELYLATLSVGVFSEVNDIESVTVQSITNDYSTVEDLQNGMARIPEYITPKRVVKKVVDKLPSYVWNPYTTFLDPACKGGEFLKEIYDRLMECEPLKAMFNNEIARSNHILSKQLFGIALSDVSKQRTTDTLNGFGYNIKVIPYYIDLLKSRNLGTNKDGTKTTIIDIINEEFGQKMKFDVVIGNPPYQDERSSIYPKFIDIGIRSSNITCMITRDNWMNGKAFKDLRKNLVGYGGVREITHYPIIGEIFKGVSVAVSIMLWEKDYIGDTRYICIKHGKKVSEQSLDITDAIIYKSSTARDIISKVGERHRWVERFKTRSYPFMDQRKRYALEKSIVSSEVFNVAIISNDGTTEFTNIYNFKNTNEVMSYKIVCGVIINEASEESPGNVLTNIKSLGPRVVSSETWSLIATFDTEEEALNCEKYIKTQLVRFIANQSVNGRSNVTDNTFEFVPIQDFTSNSDIDWSKSIANIDKQLYEKYGLNEGEIRYIESIVKPME